MGVELQAQRRRITPKELVEELNESCAYYLSIGMSVDEFWWGDNSLPKIYQKAFRIELKRKNQLLHRQGMYFYEALADVSPLLRAFAGKNTKAIPYSAEAYPIDQREIEEREAEKQKANYERIRNKMFDFLAAQSRKGGDLNG